MLCNTLFHTRKVSLIDKDKVVLFLLFNIPSWNWLYVFASHSSESQSIQHEYLIMDHSILFA